MICSKQKKYNCISKSHIKMRIWISNNAPTLVISRVKENVRVVDLIKGVKHELRSD